MLYALAAFASGIVLGARAWRPPTWWMIGLIALTSAALYLTRTRIWIPRALSLLALIFLGALNIQIRPPDHADPAILAYATGEEVEITAHITNEPLNPDPIQIPHAKPSTSKPSKSHPKTPPSPSKPNSV